MRKVITIVATFSLFVASVAAQHSVESTSPLSITDFINADSSVNVDALLESGHVGKIDLDGNRFKMEADGPKLCSLESSPPSSCLAPVKCAAIYDGMVVFGGMFGKAGDSRSSNIVGYDGERWVSLGQFGVNRTVFALEVYDGHLVAAGEFDRAGNDVITHVAAWDGRYWSSLGNGLSNAVFDLVVYHGRLVAGGDIAMAAAHGGNSLVTWDGSRWLPLSPGQYGYVYTLTVTNDGLYAGGKFVGPDGTAEDRVIDVSNGMIVDGSAVGIELVAMR